MAYLVFAFNQAVKRGYQAVKYRKIRFPEIQVDILLQYRNIA